MKFEKEDIEEMEGLPFFYEEVAQLDDPETGEKFRIGRSMANDAMYVFTERPSDDGRGSRRFILPASVLYPAMVNAVQDRLDAGQ